MEENLFNIVPNLEMLLLTKSYKELTKEEFDEISKFLSDEEYKILRNTILEVKASLNKESDKIHPLPSTKKHLTNLIIEKQISVKKNKVFTLHNIINYKIPFYQTAAAVLIFIVSITLIKFKPVEVITYRNKTDTVYVDKQITAVEKANLKTSKIDRNNKLIKIKNKLMKSNIIKTVNKNSFPLTQYEQLQYAKTMKNIEMTQTMRKGSSIRNDTLLSQFVYVMN